MKKHILTLIFTGIFSIATFGQLIVSDPAATKILMKQTVNDATAISKATATLKTLDEQLTFIKKQQENLSNVKSLISQGRMVKQILQNFSIIGKVLVEIPPKIKNLKYDNSKALFTEKLGDLSVELNILTELVSQTVTAGKIESNDIERLKFLHSLYNSSSDLKVKVRSLSGRIGSAKRNIKEFKW